MSSTITIDGFTASTKTPGAVGQARMARGKANPGAVTKKLLLLGNKTSAGSMTVDVAPIQVFTEEDVVTYYGARSEVAHMAFVALKYGIAPWIGAVTEASGGTAATWTLTFTGTAGTTAGTFYLEVGDELTKVLTIPINIAASNTPTQSGAAAVTAINTAALGRLPYTAAQVAGVVTITRANVGLRGNQHIAHLITDNSPPSTQTAALTGGTALSNGGIPMTGGAGQDTLTAILAATLTDEYEYVALAANDATSVGAFITQTDAKNHPLVGMTEFPFVALNGTQAAAITFASGTMNHALSNLTFLKSCRTHPSVIAASMAAKCATTEGASPNHRYNGEELLGVAGHRTQADVPGRSSTDAMLDAGVTPVSTKNGKAVVVRAITTYCLNGTAPDYRCLDRSHAVVAQKNRKDLVYIWDNEFSVSNPYVGPDDAEGLPLPAGVASPRFWSARCYNYLKEQEAANVNADVDLNLPYSEWDADAERIMTRIKSLSRRQNHQVGVLVDQI